MSLEALFDQRLKRMRDWAELSWAEWSTQGVTTGLALGHSCTTSHVAPLSLPPSLTLCFLLQIYLINFCLILDRRDRWFGCCWSFFARRPSSPEASSPSAEWAREVFHFQIIQFLFKFLIFILRVTLERVNREDDLKVERSKNLLKAQPQQFFDVRSPRSFLHSFDLIWSLLGLSDITFRLGSVCEAPQSLWGRGPSLSQVWFARKCFQSHLFDFQWWANQIGQTQSDDCPWRRRHRSNLHLYYDKGTAPLLLRTFHLSPLIISLS